MADGDWTVKFGFDDDASSCRLVGWQAVANTDVTICGREYKKGDMIHLRCDDGVNYKPVDGPSLAYRIKPLVWEQSRRTYQHHTACMGGIICTVWKELHEGFYHWNTEDDDGSCRSCGTETEIDAAKSAAESAYRKLVAEHLEVVE